MLQIKKPGPGYYIFKCRESYEKNKDNIHIGAFVNIDDIIYLVNSNKGLDKYTTNDISYDDEKYAKEIRDIKNKYKNDAEATHSEADKLLCKILENLGYVETVEEFNNLKNIMLKENERLVK